MTGDHGPPPPTPPPPPIEPTGPSGPPPGVDPARLERNWLAISTELFAPQPSRIERWLRRLTVPPSVTRLMVATPALRRAWFVALGVVVLIGLAAADGSRPREDLLPLLALAPLVPVLGVTMAYGAGSDPAHEASLATPVSGFRLIMIRSATVVACSVVVLALASVLTGVVTPVAFGWLLPSPRFDRGVAGPHDHHGAPTSRRDRRRRLDGGGHRGQQQHG